MLPTFPPTVLMRTLSWPPDRQSNHCPVRLKSTLLITMQPVLNMAISANVDSGCRDNCPHFPCHVKRSNGWVTSYNPAIASCIRSNHDLTWIPTRSKALAYIYYLTNYATKADISPQQILVKGALIADSIKTAGGRLANTDDLQQDSKFLLV